MNLESSTLFPAAGLVVRTLRGLPIVVSALATGLVVHARAGRKARGRSAFAGASAADAPSYGYGELDEATAELLG